MATGFDPALGPGDAWLTCPERLVIARELMEQMRTAVARAAPLEACGIAAGRQGIIEAVLPIRNQAQSPVRFVMEPLEQLRAMLWVEENGLELSAIFHSHPNGPDGPSPTDLAEFSYPGSVYIIWSGRSGQWTARAYCLDSGAALEIPLLVEN